MTSVMKLTGVLWKILQYQLFYEDNFLVKLWAFRGFYGRIKNPVYVNHVTN